MECSSGIRGKIQRDKVRPTSQFLDVPNDKCRCIIDGTGQASEPALVFISLCLALASLSPVPVVHRSVQDMLI